jgi:hypothetical protein
MTGATVDELLGALKPLLRKNGDLPICLKHPEHGVEGLTYVELRSARGAMVDLYSGTLSEVLDATALSHRLNFIRMRGGEDYIVHIFHPGHGAEPVTEITTDGDSLILSTAQTEAIHD